MHRGLECKSRKSRNNWTTGKFGLGVQNGAGQRLTVLSREHTGHSKCCFPTNQKMHGHHYMVNTEIRLIMFFVAKDGEVLYIQQK